MSLIQGIEKRIWIISRTIQLEFGTKCWNIQISFLYAAVRWFVPEVCVKYRQVFLSLWRLKNGTSGVIDWWANEWHYACQIRIRLLKQFTYRCQYIPHSITILSLFVIIQSPFQVGRQHSITTSCRMVLLILRKFEYSSENPFPSPVTDSQARALISNEFSLLEVNTTTETGSAIQLPEVLQTFN